MNVYLIIGLYILQTFIGAVLWRRFNSDSTKACFWISFFVLPNIFVVIVWTIVFTFYSLMWLWDKMIEGIEFLAGKKKIKATEEPFNISQEDNGHTTWL